MSKLHPAGEVFCVFRRVYARFYRYMLKIKARQRPGKLFNMISELICMMKKLLCMLSELIHRTKKVLDMISEGLDMIKKLLHMTSVASRYDQKAA